MSHIPWVSGLQNEDLIWNSVFYSNRGIHALGSSELSNLNFLSLERNRKCSFGCLENLFYDDSDFVVFFTQTARGIFQYLVIFRSLVCLKRLLFRRSMIVNSDSWINWFESVSSSHLQLSYLRFLALGTSFVGFNFHFSSIISNFF